MVQIIVLLGFAKRRGKAYNVTAKIANLEGGEEDNHGSNLLFQRNRQQFERRQ